MSVDSKIEWTDTTWNPVRGCTKISPGCKNCYAETFAERWRGIPGHPYEQGFGLRLVPEKLDEPLGWKKPRRVFVNSMSDLFQEGVPFEFVNQVFAVMAATPEHTYQILTKRADRMLQYCSDPQTPFRVAKAIDAFSSAPESSEEFRLIAGYPGYLASSHGFIYSKKRGGLKRLSPDIGEQGHMRVQLHRAAKLTRHGDRLLVHRIILETFIGPAPSDDSEGRHRDGNPGNNATPNLLWGDQAENRADSKRHGTYRRHAKLTAEQASDIKKRHAAGETGESLAREFDISATQVRNIARGDQWNTRPPFEWPLRNCWLGVSAENQQYADERIPLLLQTPASKRFVSYEPALGPVDFTDIDLYEHVLKDIGSRSIIWRNNENYPTHIKLNSLTGWNPGGDKIPALDWLIVGGESGPGARRMQPEWARSVRDQCVNAGVAFFFKQWGGVQKKKAGRELDGREWNEFPR